jgi:hypothetical protein
VRDYSLDLLQAQVLAGDMVYVTHGIGFVLKILAGR